MLSSTTLAVALHVVIGLIIGLVLSLASAWWSSMNYGFDPKSRKLAAIQSGERFVFIEEYSALWGTRTIWDALAYSEASPGDRSRHLQRNPEFFTYSGTTRIGLSARPDFERDSIAQRLIKSGHHGLVRDQRGWPFECFVCYTDRLDGALSDEDWIHGGFRSGTYQGQVNDVGVRLLPFYPRWWLLAANVGVLGIFAYWFPVGLFFIVRDLKRCRHGVCQKCGYAPGSTRITICPECGTPMVRQA